MSKTVFINVVPKASAQKRHEYTHWSGRKMNVTKAKGAGTGFRASVSVRKNALNTGFDKIVDNPWYRESAEEVELPSEWTGSNIWNKKKITLQNYLELKHNQPKGFYTSVKSPMFPPADYKYTFMQQFQYHLKDGMTILNLNDPKDEIMYYLALASSKIANSKNEITMTTDFFISHVNESEEEKATKNRLIRKANAKLTDIIDGKSPEVARKVAVILGLIRGSVSFEKVENSLYNFINGKDEQVININKFNDVVELLDTKVGKERFEALYLLKELVNYRIVTDTREKYTWIQAPSESLRTIGKSQDSTINWLLDPDSTEWREMMEEQLEAKK